MATNLRDTIENDFSVGGAVDPYYLSDEEESVVVREHFNSITMGNAMKPESLLDSYASEASKDGMPLIKEDVLDKVLSLAQKNNLKMGTYIKDAFTFARKYAGKDVKLFLNDYNTYDSRKANTIVKILNNLMEKDLVGGLGWQSHWDM